MDLTFQTPMQYCSLQHWILLSSPASSTAGHHFRFGPAAASSLGPLAVILHSCPAAHWTPSNLGNSSFGVKSFCPFMRFPQQVHWGSVRSRGSHRKYTGAVSVHEVPTASTLEWFAIPSSSGRRAVRTPTVTGPSWMTLHDMAHSFIELCKPLCHNKAVTHEGHTALGPP